MLIDGRALAQQVLDDLAKRVENLQQKTKTTPHLGIILVGNDPASEAYVRQKTKMAHQIHADATVYKYPENISQEKLINDISFLQKNELLHGLIIQLPLPVQLDEQTLIDSVNSNKDVDGFKSDSQFEEPIALAVIKILEEVWELEKQKINDIKDFNSWLKSQNIVVMGKGKTGGRPVMNIMDKYNAKYSIIDSKTQNTNELTSNADILICAVGNRGKIIHDGNIKKGAILIGIGMHKGSDGKLHGDYDSEEIKDKAGYYTPIPGGVGPLNAAMLLVNMVESAEQKLQ